MLPLDGMADLCSQCPKLRRLFAKMREARMDWDDLRIFLQVTRSGRMSEAAKLLGIDDSTVGRRVLRLERSVGMPLVERAGRRTAVTEHGRRLAEITEELESIILRDIAGLADAQSLVNGRVRIGAPEGLGAGYLGRKLFLLSAAHPELEIELVALPRTYSLAAREVDISITLDRPVTGQVTAQKLTDYTLDLYGSDIYFQRMGRPRSLQDLRKHVFVGYIPELLFTQQLNFLDLGDGVEVVPTIRTSSVIAQVDAVVSGAAIGVLPRYIARERPGLKLLLGDKFQATRSYWMSVHDDTRQLRRVRVVLEAVAAAVRADRRSFLR
ncbi:LysR family transcriptional regulator [Bradyrhizobium sp. Leo170]|nr:LysR family transcriptional regulator [Bradyrhizobium sp. Leo170]